LNNITRQALLQEALSFYLKTKTITMKKQNLHQGKKLNKTQLKAISGGVMRCTHIGGGCAQIHLSCYKNNVVRKQMK